MRKNCIAKPRRSDEELRRFAKAAFPRLGVQRLPRVAKVERDVTDERLLRMLRRAAPGARSRVGWKTRFLHKLERFLKNST